MKRFFVYGNANQAYEALTYNEILCSGLKSDSFRIATLSFLANDHIFISAEKFNVSCRNYGISDQDNQYPVTFEITDTDSYSIKARFVVVTPDGKYELSEDYRPLNEYSDTDNCIGAFIYGNIPFSLVSRVIFESDENWERFPKSGHELWFPKELFSTWAIPEYADLPTKSIDPEMLREKAKELEGLFDEKKAEDLKKIILKRFHAKAACYMAIKATEDWKTGKLKTNVDSAIIDLLDPTGNQFKNYAEQQLDTFLDVLPVAEPDSFSKKDPALQDCDSSDHLLLKLIFMAISNNDFKLDKGVIEDIKQRIPLDLYNSLFAAENDKYTPLIESISKLIGNRISKATISDEIKQENILYALAICVKNKGRIESVIQETAEVPQEVRRYAYILCSLLCNMSFISGAVKCNRVLEKKISDACLYRFTDSEGYLLTPSADTDTGIPFGVKVKLDVSFGEFKDYLLTKAENESIKALYLTDFTEAIEDPDEVEAFNKPMICTVDEKEYIIHNYKEYERFKEDIDAKLKERKLEFDPQLFKMNVLNGAKYSKKLQDVYNKYSGQE